MEENLNYIISKESKTLNMQNKLNSDLSGSSTNSVTHQPNPRIGRNLENIYSKNQILSETQAKQSPTSMQPIELELELELEEFTQIAVSPSKFQESQKKMVEATRDTETKLLDFAKIYEKMQASDGFKKSSISLCLSKEEEAQLKAHIITESFRQEEVKVAENVEEEKKTLTNFEKIAKSEFDKAKSSTVMEYPYEADWRGHRKDKERLHCWNFSKFVQLQGPNSKIQARIEQYEVVPTDIDYKLTFDGIQEENWDHRITKNVKITEIPKKKKEADKKNSDKENNDKEEDVKEEADREKVVNIQLNKKQIPKNELLVEGDDKEQVDKAEADKKKAEKEKLLREIAENKLEWIRMLVYYQYSSETKAFDSYSSYIIGKSHIPYKDSDQQQALFAGSDGSVFWVSGDEKDELNFHKPTDKKHVTFEIPQTSFLHKFWSEGNSYSESKRIIPVQIPVMKMFGEHRILIFSRFVYGEIPSVYLYSPEEKREIIQFEGASMLLHINLTKDPHSQTQSCLLFANPLFCQKGFKDAKEIMDEKTGEIYNEKIDHTLIPPIKRQEIDIEAALSKEDKMTVKHELQDDTDKLKKELEGKSKHEDVKKVLERDDLKCWIHCEKLQIGTLTVAQWVDLGEIFVQQFQGSNGKQFFTLTKAWLTAVCEVTAPNQVTVLHTSDKQIGPHAIIHDAAAQKFGVYGFISETGNWRVHDVSEDSTKINTKEPEEKDIRSQGSSLPKSVELLSFMIDERIKEPDCQEDEEHCESFYLIDHFQDLQWKIEHYYPFHVYMNLLQPNVFYIAWRANEQKQRASFDISQLGKVFRVPKEIGKSEGFRASITALIQGFEKEEKLTRLELRVPNFCWNAMTIKDIKFQVLLRKYDSFSVRSNRISRHRLKDVITRESDSGFYVNDEIIQAIEEESTPPEPTWKKEDGCRLIDYLTCEPPVFTIRDYNTKTCYLSVFSEPSFKHVLQSPNCMMRQCPENELKQASSDIDTVIILIDDKNQLHKLKIFRTTKNVIKVYKLLSLDLSQTACTSYARRPEGVILGRTTGIMRGHVQSMEYDAQQYIGSQLRIYDRKKRINEDYNSSFAVPNSDKIMNQITGKYVSKFNFIHNPGSRSQNPLGNRQCYGLPRAKRVINIFSDLYLIQSEKMSGLSEDGKKFNKHEPYWFMIKGDEIQNLPECLEKALKRWNFKEDSQYMNKEFIQIRSCKTIYGNCKLSLNRFDRDEDGYLQRLSDHKVEILECSREGKLIDQKNIKVKQENDLLQEEVLMNYADEVLLIRVKKHQQSIKDQQQAELYTTDSHKTLIIESDQQHQFAFVGRFLFWSTRFKKKNHLIWMYDLELEQQKSIDLSSYQPEEQKLITGTDLHQPAKKDYSEYNQLLLSACSPFQMIRQSCNNTLDAETMVWHSNHLQVTTKDRAYIFDCNSPEPQLVKTMINDPDFGNPDKYVENSVQIFQNEASNNFWTNLRPNQQGSMIEERLITIWPKQNGEKHRTPAIDIEDSKLIGLYRTFTLANITQVSDKLKWKRINSRDKFDLSNFCTLYGDQTILDLFDQEFDCMVNLLKKVEEYEIPQTASKKQYSLAEIRLASMLTHKTQVQEAKDGLPAQLTSVLNNNIGKTSLRDLLINIGWQSRKFSICNALSNQQEFGKMLKASTSVSTQELNNCFIETEYTRKIRSLNWPIKMKNLTLTSKDIQITRKDIRAAIKREIDKQPIKPLKVKMQVVVRMIELPWLFVNSQNFISLTVHLQNMPNKLYISLLLTSLLNRYWEETQKEMIFKQFLPFCCFAVMSILHFNYMIGDYSQDNHPTTEQVEQNVTLCLPNFLIWCYLVKNEIDQLRYNPDTYWRNKWNWDDMIYLTLTALVMLTSFEPFFIFDVETLRAIASVASCTMMLKFIDWLRVFEPTAFYVLLMTETIRDTKIFIILILFALMMFGIPLSILNENRGEEDAIVESSIGFWVFDMLLNQYLLALGEWGNTRENYTVGIQTNMCYAFFFAATFLSQITMLNMLIAVMGDTFDRVMENKDINSIKSKLELSADLVAILRNRDSECSKKVFFFMVEPIKNEEDDEEQDLWEGTIRTMNRVLKKQNQALIKTIVLETQKTLVFFNDLKSANEFQDQQYKDQVEMSVKKNSVVLKTLLAETKERIQKSFDSMMEEIKKLEEDEDKPQQAVKETKHRRFRISVVENNQSDKKDNFKLQFSAE